MNKLPSNQAGPIWMPSTGRISRKHGSTMGVLCSSLCISLLLIAAPSVADDDDRDNGWKNNGWRSAPLVKKVRAATRQFRDPAVAEAMGYVRDEWCVSGPEEGATGVHLVNFGLFGDGKVDAETPEALVYNPGPNGKLRLVAVEYITFAAPPVALEGHLMFRSGAPNRFGIPDPFLRLHVWAWKRNPRGTFADYNPNASCDAQPLTP